MAVIAFIESSNGLVYVDLFNTEKKIADVKWYITKFCIIPDLKFSVAGKKCGEKEYLKRELSSLKEVLKENHLHGNWYKKDKLIDTIISSFCK